MAFSSGFSRSSASDCVGEYNNSESEKYIPLEVAAVSDEIDYRITSNLRAKEC